MIEVLRLMVSATTPVGVSNNRYEPSSTVPNSTNWNGPRSSRRMRNTLKITLIIRVKNPSSAM